MITTSPKRAQLASFDNAYAVAIQNRESTGVDQYVVATGDPIQPFRVSRHAPTGPETMLAMVA